MNSKLSNIRKFTSLLDNDEIVQFRRIHDDNASIYGITMNDNRTRNCLSSKMVDSLMYYIENASTLTSNECRVLIINGNPEMNTFCSGHNLKALLAAIQNQDEEQWQKHFKMCSDLLLCIQSSPLPILCCVHGVVTASGLEIAAAADMTLCTKDTRFAIPGMNIGVNACKPATTFSQSLNHKSWRLGLEMLLTGKETLVDAQTAFRKGFINFVADDYPEMEMKAMEYAKCIASKSKLCVSIGKQIFYEQAACKEDISAAYELTSKVMVDNMLTYDAREGIGAFLEKRTAFWHDR